MKIPMKDGLSVEMEVIVRIEKDGFCAERYIALEQMLFDMDGTLDRVVNEMTDELNKTFLMRDGGGSTCN